MAKPLTSQDWVAAWLHKADHGLETADRALHAGSPITDIAARHCHQAAGLFNDFERSIVQTWQGIPKR